MGRFMLGRWAGSLAVILSLSCGGQVVVRETQAQCGNGAVDSDEQQMMANIEPAMEHRRPARPALR